MRGCRPPCGYTDYLDAIRERYYAMACVRFAAADPLALKKDHWATSSVLKTVFPSSRMLTVIFLEPRTRAVGLDTPYGGTWGSDQRPVSPRIDRLLVALVSDHNPMNSSRASTWLVHEPTSPWRVGSQFITSHSYQQHNAPGVISTPRKNITVNWYLIKIPSTFS